MPSVTTKVKYPVSPPVEPAYDRLPLGEWASIDDVPADVALVYDLANSIDERVFERHAHRTGRRDLFGSEEDLSRWLVSRGFEVDEVSEPDLELARRVRAAIRAAARANADPREIAAAQASFAEAAADLSMSVRLGEGGAPLLTPNGTGVRGALAAILVQATWAVAGDRWTRLKMCADDDCRWVFYDASRPRTGRWCAMASCGHRMKTRAYRRRRATRSRPGLGSRPDAVNVASWEADLLRDGS